MNILIIGKPSANLITLLKQSKYAGKIYTASNKDFSEFPNIEYRNFDELIKKSLALKIDIALNIDKTLIPMGIAEVFEKSRINLISVNKKWFNLEATRLSTKKLLNHYKINTPQLISVPVDFPVMIKTDVPGIDYKATSTQEVISAMQKLEGEKIFFEEVAEGETLDLYTVWDKSNVKYLCKEKDLTEVQKDRLDLMKTKLNFMFSDEKVGFIGFFGIKLVWHKNDWYVNSFDMCTEIPPDCLGNMDFLYLINSAIYQKLGEG